METVAVVNDQYSVAAGEHVPMACCPGVGYDKKLLAAIPEAVLERDYGCGDPTAWVRPGETVLDLGSGGGKMCFVVSQLVGKSGRVIGVDMNDEMLALARSAATEVAARVGHSNVDFRKGYIDDLQLDLQALDDYLKDNPIGDADSYQAMDSMLSEIREGSPLVADSSIDVVLSNCVLNLVSVEKRKNLFREIYRVLHQGGRAVISDVVSDQSVPAALRKNAHLWSTCVSGAMEEGEFLEAFAAAGFHGITLESRAEDPYLEVEGVQFRTVTVSAYKGKEGPCWEGYQAVLYRGPFNAVEDDDGHRFERGARIAVCEKTFELLGREPYAGMFEQIRPEAAVPKSERQRFECGETERRREPSEQKNGLRTTPPPPASGPSCGPGCC